MAYDGKAPSDDDLLRLVGDERKRSVGFDHDEELRKARERALNYYKGNMPDVVAMPNRSKAVSTDTRDAIETILPDLVEILAGGDDVAAFVPVGKEDEAGARQETDYVNHVVFNQNDGWLTIYSFIKDALQLKTGVVKWWWDEYATEERFEGKTAMEVAQIQQDGGEIGEITEREPDGMYAQAQPEPLYDLTVKYNTGKLCLGAIAPEDFTVGKDTIALRDATYCAHKSRVRAQDLIADGISREIVDRLPAYETQDEEIDLARDQAGENDETNGGGANDLREVEVVEHHIRVLKGDKLCLYRVKTGGGETILIEKEEVDRIQIAAITPFIVTHRFYGESVSEHMEEIQKIKTAITRAYLDSIYFALNQRMEVADTGVNEYTIADLLRNEPGHPVRVKAAGTVNAIQAGGIGFQPLDALEYFNTVGEQRTGIVRAAQGLTPDTLHETAKGALALLGQAQKRVRMIARTFAETGFKDLFLGVHALLRQHATKAATVRLRGEWVDVAPTSWSVRNDMTIEIGLGASGREQELVAMREMVGMMFQIVQMQGGVEGPFVTADNVYNTLKRLFEKSGMKAPELFVTDPKTLPPQQPKPDPKMIEAQEKLKLQAQEGQAKLQMAQQEGQARFQMEQQRQAADVQIEQQRFQLEAQLKREQMAAELGLKREQLSAELNLKREQLAAELALKRELGMVNAQMSMATSEVSPGGEPG
jgi:hypothetical protein